MPELNLESYHLLHKIPVTLWAELDQRRISVRQLLELQVDSILELDRPAGENISLYASDVLLASGEILVVDSTLAVRVADLKDRPADPLMERTSAPNPSKD